MKYWIAIAAIVSTAALAQSPPTDAINAYVAKAKFDFILAGDAGDGYRLVGELKPLYEAAMAAAKNVDQRKAIALHFAAAQTCIPSARRHVQEQESYAEQDDRNQSCVEKMADRAAEIEAAGYGE